MTQNQESWQELPSSSDLHELGLSQATAVSAKATAVSNPSEGEHMEEMPESYLGRIGTTSSSTVPALPLQNQSEIIDNGQRSIVSDTETSSAEDGSEVASSPSSRVPPWPPRRAISRPINPTQLLDEFLHVGEEGQSASSSPSSTSFHIPVYAEPYFERVKRHAVAVHRTQQYLSTAIVPSTSPSTAAQSGVPVSPAAATVAPSNGSLNKDLSQGTGMTEMTFEDWKRRLSIHRKRKPQMPRLPSEDSVEVTGDDEAPNTTTSQSHHLHGLNHEGINIESTPPGLHTPRRKRSKRKISSWAVQFRPSPNDSVPSFDTSTVQKDDKSPFCRTVAGPSASVSMEETILEGKGKARKSTSNTRHQKDPMEEGDDTEDENVDAQMVARQEKGKGVAYVQDDVDEDLQVNPGEAGLGPDESDGEDRYQGVCISGLSQQSLDQLSEDEYNEDEQVEDELRLQGPVGFVTPKRKRIQSLSTPPPAPRSPSDSFIRRAALVHNYFPNQSPTTISRFQVPLSRKR